MMSLHSVLRARLVGAGGSEPLFLADLTGWYRNHLRRGALPSPWQGMSLDDIYRSLGLPLWDVVRPWREETPGLDRAEETDGRMRTVAVETASGTLVWQWELTDDGEWVQVGFPISGAADLPAAVLWARSLGYVIESQGLTERQAAIGDAGLLALELPRRPLVQLAAELMGWQRAPRLMAEPAVALIMEPLEQQVQELATALAQLAVELLMSPDDLSQAFVSLDLFRQHLLPSYLRTAQELGIYFKGLLVRVDGPIDALLPLLGESGICAAAGVPEGEAGQTLGTMSAALGERLTLWGGIPGTLLRPGVDLSAFEAAVRRAVADARGHRGVLLGISGRVPPDADLGRLALAGQIVRAG